MNKFFIIILLVFGVPFYSHAQFNKSYELVRTADGVDLKLTHLSNPGKPILLFISGLGARGTSFEPLINRIKDDFDIYIGNYRGSEYTHDMGTIYNKKGFNGVQEKALYDVPALIRHLIATASPEQLNTGISIFGHSMGGVITVGALSNESLYNEFKPHLNTIVLSQSPYDLLKVKKSLKVLSHVVPPLLNFLKRRGFIGLDLHTQFLDKIDSMHHGENWLHKKIAPPILKSAILLSKYLFDSEGLDFESFRLAALNMSSKNVGFDDLIDFSHALKSDGILKIRGENTPLLKPQNITDLKIIILSGEVDPLATLESQKRYADDFATPHKMHIILSGWGHLKPIFISTSGEDYFHLIKEAISTPRSGFLNKALVEFTPVCEEVLKVKKKL